MKADGLASSLVMRERGWGPGMSTHSSSKRTPRASTFSLSATVMVSGVDIALENRGRDRRLTCHAFIALESRPTCGDAGVAMAVTPARDSIPFMAPSERLEQITNHLSNNYSRGLLNGDVAIITGILFSLRPRRRSAVLHSMTCQSDQPISLSLSSQAPLRCEKVPANWPSQ
jgi:hypothetical protein